MNNDELIEKATSVLSPHTTWQGRTHADVGAAVLSKSGELYLGVCVDTSSWGICAERSALAGMITKKEYQLEKVVAVWRDPKTSELHVLPPCGICRQFMYNLHEANLEAKVVLSRSEEVPLKELLPRHEWPGALDGQVA